MSDYVMEFGDFILGIPTMGLVCAKNYKFRISNDTFKIVLPNKGKYTDFDSEFFSEEDGSFEIYDGTSFNVSTLSRVLFAVKSYPDLKENQLFCPLKVTFEEETVVIYGQVVYIGAEDSNTEKGE